MNSSTPSHKACEHVAEWYFNTLLSRLDDKQNGSIVVVMQTLHEDDLVAAIEETHIANALAMALDRSWMRSNCASPAAKASTSTTLFSASSLM